LVSKKESFSSSEQVQLTLVNNTTEDLYLNYCGPALLYKLEAKENENWINYAVGLCLALYAPEFVPALKPVGFVQISLLDYLFYHGFVDGIF